MANEAYVAEKVAEVTKSPRAMLLAAIGAMSSTPTSSANTAEELGLSKEEIQGARWTALFKRGKTDLEFLKSLLEIINKKEETMTTDKVTEALKTVKDFSPKERKEFMGVLDPFREKRGDSWEMMEKFLAKVLSLTREGKITWIYYEGGEEDPPCSLLIRPSSCDAVIDGVAINLSFVEESFSPICYVGIEIDKVEWPVSSLSFFSRLFNRRAARICKILKKIIKEVKRKPNPMKEDEVKRETEIAQKIEKLV